MKKILVLAVVALFLMGGVVYATDARGIPGIGISPGPGDIMGQGNLPSTPGKIFRAVRFVDPSSVSSTTYLLSADSIVIWDTTSYDDGVTITTTTTSGDRRVAGIVVKNCQYNISSDYKGTNLATDTIGTQNWTWLQTYGKSQVDVATTVPAGGILAGDAMCASEVARLAGVYDPPGQGVSGGGGEKTGVCGFYMDDVTASSDIEVFLTGLD